MMYKDAKKAVSLRGFSSISEFIRNALRNSLYPKLTENGFTEEFEEEVLKSAAEPIDNDIVLKTDKNIHDYFIKLKLPSKIKTINGKNRIGKKVQFSIPTSNKR